MQNTTTFTPSMIAEFRAGASRMEAGGDEDYNSYNSYKNGKIYEMFTAR